MLSKLKQILQFFPHTKCDFGFRHNIPLIDEEKLFEQKSGTIRSRCKTCDAELSLSRDINNSDYFIMEEMY